jgi:hypothetical protein
MRLVCFGSFFLASVASAYSEECALFDGADLKAISEMSVIISDSDPRMLGVARHCNKGDCRLSLSLDGVEIYFIPDVSKYKSVEMCWDKSINFDDDFNWSCGGKIEYSDVYILPYSRSKNENGLQSRTSADAVTVIHSDSTYVDPLRCIKKHDFGLADTDFQYRDWSVGRYFVSARSKRR